VDDTSDQQLTLINPVVPTAGSTLTFWHAFGFENTDYDGGVLEATTDGGATWQDMGPNITVGGYNGSISTCCSNPLAGRQAWVNDQPTYTQVTVNLSPYAGQNLRIRFRLGTDFSVPATGWDIDDISITAAGACISATPTRTNTPAPATNTPTSTATDTAVATDTAIATATEEATATPTACTLEFTDVPPGHTFYADIRCLACRGIINGYNTGCETGNPCFRPGNLVTRGQLSKIVSNAAGFDDDPGPQQFEDVPAGSTFYDFIGRLANRGIISGYPCGGPGEPCVPPDNLPYFRPNANVTRGQLSKIVSEAAGFTEPVGAQQFEDVPVGSTFYDWIWRLTDRGIMNGYPCGGAGEPCIPPDDLPYFRPGANATRGQASKIVANTFFPGCNPPAKR
jgi:hypothetical protein